MNNNLPAFAVLRGTDNTPMAVALAQVAGYAQTNDSDTTIFMVDGRVHLVAHTFEEVDAIFTTAAIQAEQERASRGMGAVLGQLPTLLDAVGQLGLLPAGGHQLDS